MNRIEKWGETLITTPSQNNSWLEKELRYNTLHCTSHCSTSHYTTLHYTTLHSTALHSTYISYSFYVCTHWFECEQIHGRCTLHCKVLNSVYFMLIHQIKLNWIASHYAIMRHFVNSILFFYTMRCTLLQYTVPHYTARHHTELYFVHFISVNWIE